jgi:3,4-dihydroxyphenylacetate 2,3-dioxygenase
MMNKKYQAAYEMLPEYARFARVESGGRHLAMLFSMIEEGWEPAYLADGQSSGSWNAVITFGKKVVPFTKPVEETQFAK